MKKIDKIKKQLARLKPQLKEKFKVKEIGIFGSIVRREEKRKSDIDILVDFEEGADLFHLVGLSLFLEEKLKQKIDAIPKNSLRKEIREFVLRDLVLI